MNKEKRRSLRQAESLLHKAQKIVEAVLDDEQDAYDNMPSGLQASMQGDLMETDARQSNTPASRTWEKSVNVICELSPL